MEVLVITSPPKAWSEPAYWPPKSCTSTCDCYPTPRGLLAPPILPQGGRKEVGGKKRIQALHLSVILSLICYPCWSLFCWGRGGTGRTMKQESTSIWM